MGSSSLFAPNILSFFIPFFLISLHCNCGGFDMAAGPSDYVAHPWYSVTSYMWLSDHCPTTISYIQDPPSSLCIATIDAAGKNMTFCKYLYILHRPPSQ